jgi:hypothetical protein
MRLREAARAIGGPEAAQHAIYVPPVEAARI